jgi:hypothetical protein
MNLNFNSVFGQRIVSRIIHRIAKKKFGCDVDVQISDLQLYETADDKHVCLSANFKLSVVKNDVDKLVNMV